MQPLLRVALALVVLPGAAAGQVRSDPPAQAAAQSAPVSQLLGTWRGTSTCTDRVAAPACQDETVVYVFTPGATPATVHWMAYKIVDATRQLMGELDLSYDRAESCWKAEFTSPRLKSVWRLTVDGGDGRKLTGSARLLPGNETIRRVSVEKE
jgi:hypothetical protein